MASDNPDRTEGVEFGDVETVFAELSYPVTAEEIVAQYGDEELGRTNAEPISLRELLEPMGETAFQSEEDLKTMLLSQMPEDTEGRTNYSDRGGSLPTETEEAEQASEQTSGDLEDGPDTGEDEESSSSQSLDDA